MSTVTALVLVDLQRDYLDRPELVPSESKLLAGVSDLLAGFRRSGAPVAHVRTIVRPDGTDAMPHWRLSGQLSCVEGTSGAEPATGLQEHEGELVCHKQHYRGFSDPRLDPWLRDRAVTRVVVAGVYTHACVRETALDAYERGYEVVVATDAVATNDPEHARLTRAWLETRVAAFIPVAEILGDLPSREPGPTAAETVREAAEASHRAQRAWMSVPTDLRAALLDSWADVLGHHHDDLVDAIVREVAKPVGSARDEVRRAIAHVRVAVSVIRERSSEPELLADGVSVRHRPLGVVGILMPWNNPIALPVGKIAPAVAFGNGVLFKPAPEGQRTADLLMETCREAGFPHGLVGMVRGGAVTGGALIREPLVAAVAVTGSIATGRSVAASCAQLGLPLQAELGGNNAAIVLPDADLDEVVPALARSAFSFSGQRCTAVRRFVVMEAHLDRFADRMAQAVMDLRLGDPADPGTEVGPLISSAAVDRVAGVVHRAVSAGAQLRATAVVPDGMAERPFYPPTVLVARDRSSEIVQQETFGPVAVIQPANDVQDALAAANGVEQGLIMVVCTGDPVAAATVRDGAEVGVVQWGPGMVPVHPDAPFGGWKASGLGPPEHGRWDADFFTRPQAVYGWQ